MNEAPPQSATGFWSIERFVAFVLGPLVTAGSGWLSTFVAKKWGIELDASAVVGVFATGALPAAGLAYKWLHGRQLEQKIEPVLDHLEGNPLASEFIHTTLADLEGLAQKAAHEAVAGLSAHTAPAGAPGAAQVQ